MKTIRVYLKPYIGRMTLGLIIKFTGTMMDLVLPWLLAHLVDDLMPTGDIAAIWRCGGVMALCSLTAVTFNIGANRMAAGNSADFTKALRHDLYRHILYLPAQQREQYGIPSLVARLTSDTYNVHQLVDRIQRLGVRVIKALSKTEYEAARFQTANTETMQAEKAANSVMAVTHPAMSFLLNMGFMLVILVGAYRVNAGIMQPGKIMGFLSYFTIILNAVLSITKIFVLWSKGSASAERISAVLHTQATLPVAPPDHVETDAYISFENVSFSYNKVRNNLENISFALQKGQTLGIIGATGSGKTTLINLLLRFYDADEGCIRINGDRINSIPLTTLRRNFGVVFQNDVLLNDTVYENISFLRNISREEVARAARTAQIAEHIETMPDAYDSMLDIRGANLSGGQKQRILIARALGGKPDVLVLDDAESALDYRTNAQLRKALREEYADTTTIIVSQRVSAIKNASLILLLDDGILRGAGTHEELMQTCADYRTIANVQMGGGGI